MRLTILVGMMAALSSIGVGDVYDCDVNALELNPETSLIESTSLGKMAIDPEKDDVHTVEIEKDKFAATCTIAAMGCCGTGRALVCSFQGGPSATRPDLRKTRPDRLHNLGVTTTESKYFQFTNTKSIVGDKKAYSIVCLLL